MPSMGSWDGPWNGTKSPKECTQGTIQLHLHCTTQTHTIFRFSTHIINTYIDIFAHFDTFHREHSSYLLIPFDQLLIIHEIGIRCGKIPNIHTLHSSITHLHRVIQMSFAETSSVLKWKVMVFEDILEAGVEYFFSPVVTMTVAMQRYNTYAHRIDILSWENGFATPSPHGLSPNALTSRRLHLNSLIYTHTTHIHKMMRRKKWTLNMFESLFWSAFFLVFRMHVYHTDFWLSFNSQQYSKSLGCSFQFGNKKQWR